MSEQETPMESYWAIALSDWKRAGAWVTITLRSGEVAGPGKVLDTGATLGAAVLHDDGMRYRGLGTGWRRASPERKWNVALSEIASVKSEADS